MVAVFLALEMTLFLEMPFFLLFRRKSLFRFLLYLLLNIFTNLAMNLLFVFVFQYAFSALIVSEFVVFLLEGLFYLFLERPVRAFLVSFAANLFSLLVGHGINVLLSGRDLSVPFLVFGILLLAELLLFLFALGRKKKKSDGD